MPADPVELLLLHPLPFGGEVWDSVRNGLSGIACSAPTIYQLGETLTEAAGAVLDVVEGERLIVVGNSIGGSCALEVAAAAPDRVEHLVLIGAKAGHRPEPSFRDWALNLLETQGTEPLWQKVWEPLFSPTTPPTVVAEAREAALGMSTQALRTGLTMFHGRRDLDHLIEEWPKPLTVLTGSDDPVRGPSASAAMAERSKTGSLRIVPDCGHYVPLEQPGALAEILRELSET